MEFVERGGLLFQVILLLGLEGGTRPFCPLLVPPLPPQ